MARLCLRSVMAVGLLVLAGGCVTTGPNQPLNQPLAGPSATAYKPLNRPAAESARAERAGDTQPVRQDGVMVGLAISGGGTRAAAFGYGMLKEIEATQIRVFGNTTSLFDHVDVVSGVSGGSVLAAYVGLRGRPGLADFRERFLIRDAEESLNLSMSLDTLPAALGSGVNDTSKLPRWLDDNLFHGATMADLDHARPAHVYISASDLYNRQSFVFSRPTFDSICSDYDSYPVAHAVAASAAVPIVFAPVVLEAFPNRCTTPIPAWVDRAIANRDENEILRSAARSFRRNRDPNQVHYVKLVDGGLSDNFGVTGFVVEREKERTPYSPLTPAQALSLTRVLFLVANAGAAPMETWARTLEGPSGMDMVTAITDTAIRANVQANFETARQSFTRWRDELVRWRCSLPTSQVVKLRGSLFGWSCRDVQFFIAEIGFDQLGPERLKELSAVPTRFKLPVDQVDMVIQAGRDALRANTVFRQFLQSLSPRLPRARKPHVAAARDATQGQPAE